MSNLDLNTLDNVKRIITHDNCADGMASAMILHDVYPDIEPEFAQYDSKEQRDMEVTEGMLFVDFSPHADKAAASLEAGAIVLDHHKTSKDLVAQFSDKGLGVFGDEKDDPGICGATLAFQHVWLPLAQRRQKGDPVVEDIQPGDQVYDLFHNLATLAGIRDTWQTKDPRWQQACEQAMAIDWWPNEFLLETQPGDWHHKLVLGPILFKKKLKWAKKTIGSAFRFTTAKGTRVVMFEGLKTSSDAAEMLGTEADLVCGYGMWLEDGQVKIVYSTRSRSEFDCSVFCKAHGGGGHTKAAGFKSNPKLEEANPYTYFQGLLEKYEAGD